MNEEVYQLELFDVAEIDIQNAELKIKRDEENAEKLKLESNKTKELMINQVLQNRKTIKDLKTFENPENDDQELFNLQHDYLINGNMDAWHKLYALSYTVTKRLIVAWFESKGSNWDKEELEIKASDACYYVLRRFSADYITTLKSKSLEKFLERFPEGQYYVRNNFIGFLKSGVIHVFQYVTDLDKNTTFLKSDVLEVLITKKQKKEIQALGGYIC